MGPIFRNLRSARIRTQLGLRRLPVHLEPAKCRVGGLVEERYTDHDEEDDNDGSEDDDDDDADADDHDEDEAAKHEADALTESYLLAVLTYLSKA